MARRSHSSQSSPRKSRATRGCWGLTVRSIRLCPACLFYQTCRLPQQCLLLVVVLEATYDQDPLSDFEALAFEGNVLKWDKILIMRSSGSIPISLRSPFRLAEGLVTEHTIGVVQAIQDEGAIEALSVVVCSVDLVANHASIQRDENGRLHRMLRMEGRDLAVQGRCEFGEEVCRFGSGEAAQGRAQR